jgi:photosystem II stability/assembly factor-like uncharacterized protein
MKKRIRLYLFIFTINLFLVSCTKSENQVFDGIISYKSEVSNINEWCSSLNLVSDEYGFATVGNGKVYRTEDGGLNWSLLNSVSTLPLSGTYFFDKSIGYAFGGQAYCSPYPCNVPGSVLFKTINGGKSWTSQNIPYAWSEFNSAYFFDQNSGFIVGLGQCLKTNNGGESWQSVTIGNNNIAKIFFKSKNIGYCTSLMGDLLKTENGGQTWNEIIIEGTKGTSSISFINENIGYVIHNNHLLKTVDGGSTWGLIETGDYNTFYVYFINENTGLIIQRKYTSSGIIAHLNFEIQLTIDGGKTWSTKELGEQEFNAGCVFSKGNTVYSLAYDKIFTLRIE